MFTQIVGKDLHRALLYKTNLRMAGNVIGHGKQFCIHQLPGAGYDLVALRIRAGEPLHQRRNIQRSFQVSHLLQHAARSLAFGWGFLRSGNQTRGQQENSYRNPA